MKKALIVIAVLTVIGIAIYFLTKKCGCTKSPTGETKCGCNESTDTVLISANRKAVIDEILEKGSSTPEQEITFEALSVMTLDELKALLTRVKEDAFILANQ